LNSRGSLVPILLNLKKKGEKKFPLTHIDMTRFWITLNQATDLTLKFFSIMKGGEMIIPKIPSIKIIDLMQAISPGIKYRLIGLRPGEKIHELMCPADSSLQTIEFKNFYIIAPTTDKKIDNFLNYSNEKGKKVSQGFEYRSDTNPNFLNLSEIKKLIKA
jgi:UDP-N-acetylglucosamine 4,6-dehydratase